MSTAPPELLEILRATSAPLLSDHLPVEDELRCEARILDRITEIGRFVRTQVRFASGFPILLDASCGLAFAAAWGTEDLVLRLGATHPGMLTKDPPHHEGLDDVWWNINPWPQDTTFQRGNDILRHAVRRAIETLSADR